MRRRSLQRALGALILITATGAGATDLEVRAKLEPETLGIEQLATLTIEVEASGMGRLQPDPEFQLENLRVIAGPYSQESFQFLNGRTSRSATISWRVRPLEIGRARVHSIVVRVGDRVIELSDLHLTVQRESIEQEESPRRRSDPFEDLFQPFREPRRGRPTRGRGEVFLRATASPSNPFVGQQVLYTLYLYTQSDISSINPESLPDFQGFWVREVPQPKRFDPEMVEIEGKTFARVKLLERAIFPLREGEFRLKPTRALMAVKVPVTTMRLSLLSQTEEIQRVSNSIDITVRPLPPPPPNYTGAVGDLKLETRLDPPIVETGEATTLRVRLSGRGLLQGLPDPALPKFADLQVYPPQQVSSDEVRRGEIHGERTWSYVLVPSRPGQVEIPPIELPYFDVDSEQYRLAASDALQLTVLPSTKIAAGRAATNIHPIRSAALPAAGASSPWRRGLPHGLLLAAILGFVAAWGTRQTERFSPEHRAATHRLAEHLEHAGTHERPRRAAAELEEAWRVFLHERWEVSPGTPSTRWQHELEQRGAERQASRDLAGLSEDLHYLRYAPQLSSTEALQGELIQRSRRILKSLR